MKFEMKNEKRVMRKAGVSLITVLLLMLVATIAATATYKWITSEGRSSASRLRQSEAYQSAVAGIENTRSWMTFHANDVGALIRQYMNDKSSPRKAINLDGRLRTFQRAGQDYHVWLTGVNIDGNTYRLKILSSGEAANGSRHNEVAILVVDGLYQVTLPQTEHHSTIEFDFAYYGGSYTSSGNTSMTSGVVNGNWSGNPPVVDRNWVVTGNAILSGNNLTVGQTACIGGNASIENNGITATDIYVGGAFDGLITRASGSVFFDGYARHTGTGSMVIDGNLTVNGTYVTAQNASGRATRVGGNLCVSDSGTIVSNAVSDVIQVAGNVWMPGPQNLWYGSTDSCVCEVFDKSNNGSYVRTELCSMNNGNPNYNWPYAGFIVRCGDIVASNDQISTNKGSFDKIILGTDAASQVFINSAITTSTYNTTLVDGKNFTENASWKRNCEDAKKISTNDEFSITIENDGSDHDRYPAARNLCGTWGNPQWKTTNIWTGSGDYYVPYSTGWDNWGGGTYKPYSPKVAESDTMFGIYYTGGDVDVNFTTYNLTDWKKKGNSGWSDSYVKMGYVRGDTERDNSNVFKPTSTEINNKFVSPVEIGAYLVGGQLFFDPRDNTYKGYNYDMDINKATGSPYCRKKSGNDFQPECGVTPWFKSKGTVSNTMPNEREFTCAESVMSDCFSIWEPSASGCDGSKYFVDDPLVTCYDNYLEYATKGCAANITTWPQNGFEAALNSCYTENTASDSLKQANLYNGYLVVHITGANPGYNYGTSGTLNGKYIIVVDNRVKAQNGFPRTSSDTKVFLYLAHGADKIQGTLEHYFIYTKEDTGTSDQLNLTGTLYSPAALCVENRFQSSTLTFDPELIQSLTDAGVIAQNDGSSSCGVGGGAGGAGAGAGAGAGGGGDVVIIDSDTKDGYYISMAPQLGVSVETQYEAKETPPASASEVAALDQSFIVLPRVIYLPRDPYGKLKDYYSVVPLNGSSLKQNDVGIQCTAGLPTEGDLYSGGNLLTQGVYRCVASATGHNPIPFWVTVSETLRGTPQVYFVESVQEMPATGAAAVHAYIPPHANSLTVLVSCPATLPSGWSVNPPSPSTGVCSFTFNSGEDGEKTLFNISTSGASNGTIVFQLLPGEGYAISNPFTSELHVSNLATINRVDPSPEEIDDYCEIYPDDCPEVGHRGENEWPDCKADSLIWLKLNPDMGSVVDTNNSWTVPAGGSGQLTFEEVPVEGCVVIIPIADNSLNRESLVADHSYELKAIAKARKSSIKVGFTGNMGGKNPNLSIATDARSISCIYDNVKDSVPKACTLDLYNGDTVRVSISKSDGQNSDFNYWKCENNGGQTCPTTDPISSAEYTKFVIKDNKAIIYAHFGEVDEHCFFDEFKQGGVACNAGYDDQYCIDNCGDDANSVCVGVVDAHGKSSISKWHLVEGSFGSIEDSYGNVSIDNAASRGSNRSNREAVKVMSTTKPGLRGTLKALVQLPKATSSYGATSANIAKSGFLLHSNAAGTEFLMLNVYVNTSGVLGAKVCVDGGTESCVSGIPKKNDNGLDVTPSSMVMVEATLTDTNTLELTVFSGNYYGTPDTYTLSLKLYELSTSYSNRDHEYVGFSMADPNFKIYGIGWSSADYGADECWDTYPTVKCSFSAVASNGVIPTGTTVEPWLGHSGWFDSKNCTPEYYYYNGTDACSGQSGVETACPSTGYNFSQDGAGQHGYRDNGVDVKAAKAWLSCTSADDQVVAWSAGTETLRAHCGLFWTGEFTECLSHADFGTLSSIGSGLEGTLTLAGTSTANLRAAKLNITLENPNNSELEVWLLSENATWGADDFASSSVRFTGTSKSIDVVQLFAEGAQGFDPEHVRQVVIKNHGEFSVSNVSVTSVCKNAVGISDCEVSYNNQTGKWEVSANVGNKGKVSSYAVSGQVGSTGVVSSTADPDEWSGDRATWKITHNPYGSYQGSTFDWTASVTDASGGTYSTTCGSVTVGSISCSNYSASDIESGAAWPAFNFRLNNCPQNKCDYDIYFDDALLGSTGCTTGACSGTCLNDECNSLAKTKDGNAEECTTEGGCSHKYKVQSSDEENKPFTPCEVTFKVKKKVTTEVTASCSFENASIYLGQTAKFKANSFSVSNKNISLELFGPNGESIDTQASFWANNNYEKSGISPASTGTFTYILNAEGGEACRATLTVRAPTATCSISPTNLSQGEKVTVSVSSITPQNTNLSLVVKEGTTTKYESASYWSNNNYSQEFEMSTIGSYSYKVLLAGAELCSQTITVSGLQPTVQCPSAKLSYKINKTASFKAQNLSNCGSGCDYRLAPASGSAYASSDAGTYNSKDTEITWTAQSSTENDVDYTFTVYNHDDHSVNASCTGKMEFIDPGSGCHCETYCGSGCESNIVTGDIDQNPFTGCVFVASATRLNINQGYTVNGSTPSNGQLCYDNATNCANALASYSAVDGGWYFNIVGKYTSIRSSGYNPCAPVVAPTISSCPTTKAGVGKSASITPVSPACNAIEECNYSIKKSGVTVASGTWRSGKISFTDAGATSAGDVTYSLTVTNSKGSDSENCTVSYLAPVTLTNGSTNVDVPCGVDISANATCSGNVVISCSGAFYKTVGTQSADKNNTLNYYAAWQNLNNTYTTSCDTDGVMKCSIGCW